MKFIIFLFFCLGATTAQAADFSTLLCASAKQGITDAFGSHDFPMPETPSVIPQISLPFMPPSDPYPFFTETCMAHCSWGYDNRSGAGPCACYDPFPEFNPTSEVVCLKICHDGTLPAPPCVCPGDSSDEMPQWPHSRGKHSAKVSIGTAKSLSSFLEGISTATITCGGVEYSIFAYPMKCDMGSVISVEWLKTGAAYYAYEAVRTQQPRLKAQALEYLSGTGNDAAAAAVAGRSSRIFSDGAVLFVADAGKVSEIADSAVARRVYESTFPLAVSEKARLDLGVHKAVIPGVLACMASDACWGSAADGRN